MTNRIKTSDARAAFNEVLREKAKEAAGNNTLVSKTEAKKLDPFLKGVDETLRAEGGKGTRVSVDELVARGEVEGMKVWEEFNPPGHGTDSTYLAKAEVKDIAKKDPALGALTELAMLRAGKRGTDVAAVARDFFTAFDFAARRASGGSLPGGHRVDARPGQAERASVPAQVRDAFDFYYRAEDADWASVSLHEGKIAGHDVYAIFMHTDGDDGYFEAWTKGGAPLTSGRLMGDALATLDPSVERTRLAPTFTRIDGVESREGYSEPVEIAAHGQVPRDWAAPRVVDAGLLRPTTNGHLLGALDVPTLAAMSDAERQVTTAALEVLWDVHLKHTVFGDEPVELGRMRQGVLKVGEFFHTVDQKTYWVADWQDIDDGSFTLYFELTDLGPKLAVSQFNN